MMELKSCQSFPCRACDREPDNPYRDYNTRFSGITQEEHAQATLSLSSIRRSLDAFINRDTIIIGHALHNDLNTLRMVHHQCIDTAIIFPHRAGPPYRRSLRDLCVVLDLNSYDPLTKL